MLRSDFKILADNFATFASIAEGEVSERDGCRDLLDVAAVTMIICARHEPNGTTAQQRQRVRLPPFL